MASTDQVMTKLRAESLYSQPYLKSWADLEWEWYARKLSLPVTGANYSIADMERTHLANGGKTPEGEIDSA